MPSYYLIDVDSLKTKEAHTLTWIDDPLCIGESRSGVSTCYRQKKSLFLAKLYGTKDI